MSVENTLQGNTDAWGRAESDLDGSTQDPEYTNLTEDESYLRDTINKLGAADTETLAGEMGVGYTQEKIYEIGEDLLEKDSDITVSERDGNKVYHKISDDSFL